MTGRENERSNIEGVGSSSHLSFLSAFLWSSFLVCTLLQFKDRLLTTISPVSLCLISSTHPHKHTHTHTQTHTHSHRQTVFFTVLVRTNNSLQFQMLPSHSLTLNVILGLTHILTITPTLTVRCFSVPYSCEDLWSAQESLNKPTQTHTTALQQTTYWKHCIIHRAE